MTNLVRATGQNCCLLILSIDCMQYICKIQFLHAYNTYPFILYECIRNPFQEQAIGMAYLTFLINKWSIQLPNRIKLYGNIVILLACISPKYFFLIWLGNPAGPVWASVPKQTTTLGWRFPLPPHSLLCPQASAPPQGSPN